jgi:protein TonB
VQYLKLPPVEVPRASRRAGESGTVWLRVVVDVRGLPAQIHVQRSSGFARLDEQARGVFEKMRDSHLRSIAACDSIVQSFQ